MEYGGRLGTQDATRFLCDALSVLRCGMKAQDECGAPVVHRTGTGVGFRYFAQRAAPTLALPVTRATLDDGRVEVYATGPEEKVSQLATS